ncbi:MAG: type VI secretion system tube protein Hcp [Blastocatellia bacterium]|nr:MAG: type VI secretion system tube protein Hcp [Blastocatellia bacterium]
MPFDSFLKVATVPGESTDDKHPEWIEVLSYTWASSHAQSATEEGGGQRVEISDFSVVKQLDKASPRLFLLCATGETIADATLEICKAAGEKQKFMTYKMSGVLVVSVKPGGSGKSGDALPLEEISFRFSKIELEYIPIDKMGKPQPPVLAGWDVAKNTKI